MTRNEKLVVVGLVVVGIAAGGLTAEDKPQPSAVTQGEHDCSGRMKEAMRTNPSLAAKRHELCDMGGEANVDAMIKDAYDERHRPAF